ncbi:hypothetical protein [Dolichospermum flos-aquae]|uniref:Uncharacterized protein n=1 Tax=Dolichospermum flos-aquae LEGE 04289 TaxID=1828708 RepID=A0ACC5PY38_DOLFA|nr:hypothetical protein [Dolichospermum flos-aquae]MBE9217731.1 hypothetical protein [Dolichospermum flos-aquae LEGE 04289]
MNTMNFWDELKKGMYWGAWLGAILSIITIMALLISNTPGTEFFIYLGIFLLETIIGAVLGGIAALAILAIIGTLQWINWFLILILGGIITILTPFLSSVISWISLIIVPILYFVRKILNEKAPQWLEKAVDESMVLFLTSLIFTGLVILFEKFTGFTLLHI